MSACGIGMAHLAQLAVSNLYACQRLTLPYVPFSMAKPDIGMYTLKEINRLKILQPITSWSGDSTVTLTICRNCLKRTSPTSSSTIKGKLVKVDGWDNAEAAKLFQTRSAEVILTILHSTPPAGGVLVFSIQRAFFRRYPPARARRKKNHFDFRLN